MTAPRRLGQRRTAPVPGVPRHSRRRSRGCSRDRLDVVSPVCAIPSEPRRGIDIRDRDVLTGGTGAAARDRDSIVARAGTRPAALRCGGSEVTPWPSSSPLSLSSSSCR